VGIGIVLERPTHRMEHRDSGAGIRGLGDDVEVVGQGRELRPPPAAVRLPHHDDDAMRGASRAARSYACFSSEPAPPNAQNCLGM